MPSQSRAQAVYVALASFVNMSGHVYILLYSSALCRTPKGQNDIDWVF